MRKNAAAPYIAAGLLAACTGAAALFLACGSFSVPGCLHESGCSALHGLDCPVR